MMEPTHRDLAAGAWWGLSLPEQLGNIGSEIRRAERWKTRNPEVSRGAFYRALELFDLTLSDPRLRQSPPRLREIARAREVVADYFAGPNQTPRPVHPFRSTSMRSCSCRDSVSRPSKRHHR
jgi:hypothetical protein